MKTLALGFTAGLSLAGVGSALAQEVPPYAGTYYETLTEPSCSGNPSCTFVFKEVPALPIAYGNGTAVLNVSRVNCRFGLLGNGGGIAFATLGKTSNPAKLLFLSFTPLSGAEVYEQTTQFFVGPGASPIITIQLSGLLFFNDAFDPTCSVSGFMQ
jgi:hypothetical protein